MFERILRLFLIILTCTFLPAAFSDELESKRSLPSMSKAELMRELANSNLNTVTTCLYNPWATMPAFFLVAESIPVSSIYAKTLGDFMYDRQVLVTDKGFLNDMTSMLGIGVLALDLIAILIDISDGQIDDGLDNKMFKYMKQNYGMTKVSFKNHFGQYSDCGKKIKKVGLVANELSSRSIIGNEIELMSSKRKNEKGFSPSDDQFLSVKESGSKIHNVRSI